MAIHSVVRFFRSRSLILFIALVGVSSAACGDIDPTIDAPHEAVTAQSTREETSVAALIVEGSPQAVGVLSFLNDETTDFALLDDVVRLDSRSARTLIHHRNGADGVFATWDDNPFDSIAEVDAVRWVGDGAINRILTHVVAEDLVPRGDESLGVYDGVSFSVDEAASIVTFVNSAPEGVLDRTLNRRAVDSIMAARPIPSVERLSKLYYVGPSALRQIKLLALGGRL